MKTRCRPGGSIRNVVGLVAFLSLSMGAWECGQGLWIYAKSRLAQHLLQRAWVRSQIEGYDVKPWPWADTSPIARLRVPRHGIDHIVLRGASGRTLAFGPGHHEGTSRPGSPGVAMIAGHRDTHFAFLSLLEQGDVIEVHDRPGGVVRYQVTGTAVIDSRIPFTFPSTDTPVLLLLTCYPFDAVVPGGPLRYVVEAQAVSPT